MDRRNDGILNRLLEKWPAGVVAPTSWLSEMGVSRQLLSRYIEYGWVERVVKGAALKKGDRPTWEGVVYSLQALQGLDIWVGGKSALQVRGLGHYVSRGAPAVWLFSEDVQKLPKWIDAVSTVAEFRFQQLRLFSPKAKKFGFSEMESQGVKFKLSSPERAIMELLNQVPSKQTFEEAELIFENLTSLRPDVVQALLLSCKSIKVKRLFLYFADRSGHKWFSKLDPEKIDLGSGKRAIVPTGRLDTKYQILIPRSA